MKYKYVLIGIALMIFFSFSSSCSSEEEQKNEKTPRFWLNIASFNIEYDNKNDPDNIWKKRKALVKNIFNKYKFDIVGVQEPYLGQLKDMRDLLPNYGYVGKTVTGSFVEDKKLSVGIFYNKNVYEVEKWNHFWLSETPDTLSKGWDAQQYRICTWAFFKNKMTEENFYFFSTHLEFQGLKARNESAKLLLDTIPEMTEGYPSILVGDFNADQNTEDYKLISNSNVFQDSYSMTENHTNLDLGTLTRYNPNFKSSRRIDHIFVAEKEDPVQVRNWSILHDVFDGKLSSDHNPVMIEISFN